MRAIETKPFTTEELKRIYTQRAPFYDVSSHSYALLGYRLNSYRARGIELLQLHSGDTVVEIGCGTGANFVALQDRIGRTGRIIGVDLTPAMLDEARKLVRRSSWENVELVQTPAGAFHFPECVDAVFSTFALTLIPEFDDVIRRAARALRPGGRFVVVDFKAPDNWSPAAVRAAVPFLRPFGVTLELKNRQPWESLKRHLNVVRMEERFFGTTYIATGEKSASCSGANPGTTSHK